MTGFQKGTNDRPQNEAGTFALRLAVERTETIGPSDHANQRNQVTRPVPAGAGSQALQEHRVLAGLLVRQWASWQDMQVLHRGLDREGKDPVDGRQGDDNGRLALQQPAYTTRTQLKAQSSSPWGTVGSRGSAMTHVNRWLKYLSDVKCILVREQ